MFNLLFLKPSGPPVKNEYIIMVPDQKKGWKPVF